jgi:hypothetical protein
MDVAIGFFWRSFSSQIDHRPFKILKFLQKEVPYFFEKLIPGCGPQHWSMMPLDRPVDWRAVPAPTQKLKYTSTYKPNLLQCSIIVKQTDIKIFDFCFL